MAKLVAFLVVLLCGKLAAAASADLISVLEQLSEGPLARLLDLNIDPPPRTAGFTTLLPQKSIRLTCTKTREPRFQEILFGDVNLQSKLNFSLPLTIAIHGWQERNLSTYSALTMPYLRFANNTNYCLLDWRAYSEFGYQIAARQSVPLVAQYLFGFLQNLSLLYFPLERVTLIGFSMGGQIAGLTGKLLPGRLGTIYALDPAGPLFSHPVDIGPRRRLDASDAQYVQVIYTSRYTAGFGKVLDGAQNFLPNKGYHPQQPCAAKGDGLSELAGALQCSHRYAVSLFVSSLDPNNPIIGKKCPTIFGARVCLMPTRDRLGIYAQRIRGDFYL
ncbi:phospholipase A1 member A-like [Anopheles merus]|uniref:Lipase domain-containing protein n=1 Tax=Anopheles merus TaxID=30066 RepID=A0A182VEU1_ANOME|nr:phospholipase A1 member A-like [Anopheles merus]